MNNYRHGDLCLFEVSELPAGMEKSDEKVLMAGSHGHNHTYDNGDFYPHEDGLVIGYLVAATNTKLFHPEHGRIVKGKELREAKIPQGIYQLRRQQEDTHDGMKPVID